MGPENRVQQHKLECGSIISSEVQVGKPKPTKPTKTWECSGVSPYHTSLIIRQQMQQIMITKASRRFDRQNCWGNPTCHERRSSSVLVENGKCSNAGRISFTSLHTIWEYICLRGFRDIGWPTVLSAAHICERGDVRLLAWLGHLLQLLGDLCVLCVAFHSVNASFSEFGFVGDACLGLILKADIPKVFLSEGRNGTKGRVQSGAMHRAKTQAPSQASGAGGTARQESCGLSLSFAVFVCAARPLVPVPAFLKYYICSRM